MVNKKKNPEDLKFFSKFMLSKKTKKESLPLSSIYLLLCKNIENFVWTTA